MAKSKIKSHKRGKKGKSKSAVKSHSRKINKAAKLYDKLPATLTHKEAMKVVAKKHGKKLAKKMSKKTIS